MGNANSTLLSNTAVKWLFSIVIFLVTILLYKLSRYQKPKQIVEIKNIDDLKWVDIPPTPATTLPLSYFILYCISTTFLFPIHILICLINGTYKLLIYAINKLFFHKSKALLTPIYSSPNSYVIITGAASGIGKDMALCYAEKGFSIILIDINSTVESYANELGNKFSNQFFRHLTIDLSAPNAANEIYNTIINKWKISDVVILVNNAGFGLSGEFLNQNIKSLTTMVSVNAIICIELGQIFGRYFVMRGKGRICQMASTAAYLPGVSHAVYHATKAFVRNWAMAFGYELIATGVGVTVVSPAPVRTLFAKKSNMTGSLIFGAMSEYFTYSSMSVARAAVKATLNGKREIVHGPLFSCLQSIFRVYGETYNIMTGKFLQQDRTAKHRSAFQKYQMN